MHPKLLFALSFYFIFFSYFSPIFRFESSQKSVQSMAFLPVSPFRAIPSYFNSVYTWCNRQIQKTYDDSDAEFIMRNYKVKPCYKRVHHDWAMCPYKHQGERIRRRDPYKFSYSRHMCFNFRRQGRCSEGDNCRFAHGAFEFWLHPSRYRTRMCNLGHACRRPVCFFAHNVWQIRRPFNYTVQNHANNAIGAVREYKRKTINITIDVWGDYYWQSYFFSQTNEESSNGSERGDDQRSKFDFHKVILDNYPILDKIKQSFGYINNGERGRARYNPANFNSPFDV